MTYCCFCPTSDLYAPRRLRRHSPRPASPVGVMYGPVDDGGVPKECHSFPRALPEVLQWVYVMKVPVQLCGMLNGAVSAVTGLGLTYSVHKSGYGSELPTTKP